jgi:hypothetical protein
MGDVSALPRLPTRCPACKGAVIQRMPRSTPGTFIWFSCLFCSHIWKFRIDDTPVNPNGEVTGAVFIVTKGGRKHKLGSVAVNAIPEDALKKHLETKTQESEVESQKLQRDIDRLTAMLRIAKAEEDRLWKTLQRDESNSRKAEAWRFVYNKATAITQQITDLQARRQNLTSGEHFFDGLPSGISTAKTDADGNFTLTIPREGRYGLVARASRELLKGMETYFWFVWVNLDGEPLKHLSLSTDNMMGAGSPDSALQ